jgi:hypothetical protein
MFGKTFDYHEQVIYLLQTLLGYKFRNTVWLFGSQLDALVQEARLSAQVSAQIYFYLRPIGLIA